MVGLDLYCGAEGVPCTLLCPESQLRREYRGSMLCPSIHAHSIGSSNLMASSNYSNSSFHRKDHVIKVVDKNVHMHSPRRCLINLPEETRLAGRRRCRDLPQRRGGGGAQATRPAEHAAEAMAEGLISCYTPWPTQWGL